MKAKNILLLFSTLFLFTSCPKSEELIEDSVSIEFYNHINGTPIVFDSITGYSEWFNTYSGQTYNVLNLYYLITEIKLTNENGFVLKNLSDIHFISSDDNNTNYLFIPEILSCGEYSNIDFVFGINSEKNISNSFLDEDFHTQMFWPDFMGGGYHYMQLDGKYISNNGNESGYNYHAIRAVDSPGPNPTFPQETFFKVDLGPVNIQKECEITISMNIANWFEIPNTWDLNELNQMLMANSDAQILMYQNGQNVFNIESVE